MSIFVELFEKCEFEKLAWSVLLRSLVVKVKWCQGCYVSEELNWINRTTWLWVDFRLDSKLRKFVEMFVRFFILDLVLELDGSARRFGPARLYAKDEIGTCIDG